MNQYGTGLLDPEQLILKGLDTTSASGQALIPQVIDPAIVELATQLSPLRTMIPRPAWRTKTYDRPRRTAFGRARAVGDGTSTPSSQGTYNRFNEDLKIVQAKGGTTGFLQFASQELIDIAGEEVVGQTMALQLEEEHLLIYGNKSADAWQFPGLEQWSQGGNSVIVEGAGATVTTAMLDTLIDRQTPRGMVLNESNAFFMLSPRMISKVSAIEASKQHFVNGVEFPGGFRFTTYRNIPLVNTAFIAANQAWTGSTVTGADVTTGGTIPQTTTYRYFVAAVLQTGETLPSAETSVTTATDGLSTHKIRLTWSAPTEVGSVRLYKIYRTAAGGGTGTEVLYTVIPGTVYQADANFGFLTAADVTSWEDTNVRTTQVNDYANARVTGANYTPAASFATSANDELATDEEDIWLCITGSPVVSGGPTLLIPTGKSFSYMPLAKLSDRDDFLIVGYETLVAVEQLLGRITRAKIT